MRAVAINHELKVQPEVGSAPQRSRSGWRWQIGSGEFQFTETVPHTYTHAFASLPFRAPYVCRLAGKIGQAIVG